MNQKLRAFIHDKFIKEAPLKVLGVIEKKIEQCVHSIESGILKIKFQCLFIEHIYKQQHEQ